MTQPSFFDIVGFGPDGWGGILLAGALMTFAVAICGMILGLIIGTLGAWAKVSGGPITRGLAEAYTNILRGVPDLLVIFLVYFGGSAVLTNISAFAGNTGFVSFPGFIAGFLAVGVTSGALNIGVLRGGLKAVHPGELEAAQAFGMSRMLRFRRIVAPLVLRHAIPGLGNSWLNVIKESSLLSVTGVAELLRQAQVGAGSTNRPFDFYIAAGIIYVAIAALSGLFVLFAERHYSRGTRRL
ncbi:ABC transporter permease subunit [Agrobacterium rhizogenes]|uniref:ABC transporter permease n=1 Tax=Rhizobium rhizogenes TaxID=359 RepID=UPI0015738FD0|nr:ABC transporter permease subunit [Rhizobium rhizogenes]NTF91512.1 ABC transporter permease subunit [Rhizobium rhizogenes]